MSVNVEGLKESNALLGIIHVRATKRYLPYGIVIPATSTDK